MIEKLVNVMQDSDTISAEVVVRTNVPHIVMTSCRLEWHDIRRRDLMLHMDSTVNGVVTIRVTRSV